MFARLVAWPLTMAALMGVAGSAAAATVFEREDSGNKGPSTYHPIYSAEPGEANDLSIEREGNGVLFTDPAAVVRATAGRGCVQRGPHAAYCPRGAGPEAALADGDDRARGFGSVWGGDGADRLEVSGRLMGEAGDDELHGGMGSDEIDAGTGADAVFGGPGNDRFRDLTPSEGDTWDGGPGYDWIEYLRRVPVEVDLVRGLGGEAGEGDRFLGMEGASAIGGLAFAGTSADNQVYTVGPSSIVTGAGRDTIRVGHGRDRIDAGSGDDDVSLDYDPIDAPDAPADEVRCGPGFDRVGDPGPTTALPDCERIDFAMLDGPRIDLRRSGGPASPLAGVVWTPLTDCYSGPAGARSCRVSGRVTRAGRTLAYGSGVLTTRRRTLRLMPTSHGRRLIASGRCVLATVRASGIGYKRHRSALVAVGRGCKSPPPLGPAP